ncbi:tape measure protein [Hydrogenophaga sp. NH-16]|uniref:tape measure protein n=1 Tax=Hydrogenophaga sp. NH-16 TaxID=2184519 RepID=UPI000FD81220|nr:tape measure protein [Hydrogenophaga sp. NH-16]
MATTNQRIRYDLEAAVSGEQDVAALARQLEGLADTLEGDLKIQALASAQALRELGAKQGAIDNFVKLKSEAGSAADRLREAQSAAQQLGQAMAASGAPTRAQAGQMEKLRDAVRSAKTELQDKTRALDNSRATLRTYGVASDQVAASERSTRAAIAQARDEVAKLAPAYTAAGNAAAAAGLKQTQSAQAVRASLSGVGDTLRSIQTIALTAVGGTFLTSMARDVGAVADQFNSLRARISLVTGDGPALEAAFEAVRQIALDTGSALETTADLFTRVYRAGKEVGLSQQQALQLTETINKAIQVSGGSAQAADAAITQLIQGLQGGVLRGEEFNSVMEQAPRLAKALADGLGVTTGELRKMAQEGRLTSEVVLTALQGQAQAVADEFSKLPPTIGRALQNLNTNWTTYIGNVDQATGASQAAAAAINAVGENLDEIAGLATRAGAVFAAAIAVQAAGALRAYIVEAAAARTATSLLALQMSALPKTLQIAVAFTGFEVGYQIGEMLRENSAAARQLGVATVAFVQGNIEVLRLLKESAAAIFTDDTIEAATERFKARINETKAVVEQMWEDAEQAPGPVETAAGKAADAIASIGTAAEVASGKIRISSVDQVEAFEAARIAKLGDAQAAEANLRVQLQLAQQSEDMARFLGNEYGVRQARIRQYEIEIQIAEAKVAVSRAEAEGSIAVAQAKLAEMAASKNVDLVKQAELESSIKLARARLAEADATGQATELMRRQLEQFRNGSSAADGLGGSLDNLSGKQRRLAAETRNATQAMREQASAAADDRYGSPLGDNKYGRPEGGSIVPPTREERLKGQTASDETLYFSLLAKLQQGTLGEGDVGDLQNVVRVLKNNQALFDTLGPGDSSLEALADDRRRAAARVQFEQAIARLTGGSGAQGAQTVGRKVTLELKNADGTTSEVNTDEQGAANLVRTLKRAGLSARG